MKFEYKKDKYVDLGLTVKHGNVQNVVLFWDENQEAAQYIIEVFRISWQFPKEGFFEEAEVQKRHIRYGREEDCLSTYMPAIIDGEFVEWQEEKDNIYGITTTKEIVRHQFSEAKGVCTINVDRNTFYHSINDLPYGNYIVCFSAENRNGEVIGEETPYYFYIDDANKIAENRFNEIKPKPIIADWHR